MFQKALQKTLINITSKRFITLMIATWFQYSGIDIDPNWLVLAGFYIGVDTMRNDGLFSAFSAYLTKNEAKA